MCPWRRLLALWLKSRGYVTCPSCPPPAGVSQLWIHGAPAAHTEWERCPPTTELHGSLQKSPSPWRPGRTNKKRREWNNDRWILQHHRGGWGGMPRAYRGDEVGCGGGDGGPGWGRAVTESLGEEGPHDGITGEQQASAEQPQGDVELETHRGATWSWMKNK